MAKPRRHKGRSDRGHFVMITFPMKESAAWLALSGNAIKLWIHLVYLSKGANGFGDKKGDELFLSARQAAEAVGVTRNTALRCFEELIGHGFLRQMSKGSFDVKGRASTWRLTHQEYPQANLGPTNEWRDWRPTCKKQILQAQKLDNLGSKIGQVRDQSDEIGSKIVPIRPEPAPTIGPKIEPHVYLPWEGGAAPSADELRDRLQKLIRSNFGRNLCGIQRQIARRAELSDAEISRFKAGNSKLCDGKRAKIARALDFLEAQADATEPAAVGGLH
jgi:hypothetical protein